MENIYSITISPPLGGSPDFVGYMVVNTSVTPNLVTAFYDINEPNNNIFLNDNLGGADNQFDTTTLLFNTGINIDISTNSVLLNYNSVSGFSGDPTYTILKLSNNNGSNEYSTNSIDGLNTSIFSGQNTLSIALISYSPTNVFSNFPFSLNYSNANFLPIDGDTYQLLDVSQVVLSTFVASNSVTSFVFDNIVLGNINSNTLQLVDTTSLFVVDNQIIINVIPREISFVTNPSVVISSVPFILDFSDNAVLPINGRTYQLLDGSLNVLSSFDASNSAVVFEFENVILSNTTNTNISKTLYIKDFSTSSTLYTIQVTVEQVVIDYTPKTANSGISFGLTYSNNSMIPIIGHTYNLIDISTNNILSTFNPSQQVNNYSFYGIIINNTDVNTITKTLKVFDVTTNSIIDTCIIIINPSSINQNGNFITLSGTTGYANWNMNGQHISRDNEGQGLSNSVSFAASLSNGELSILSQSFTTIPRASYNLSYYIYNSGANQQPELFQALWNGNLIQESVINNSNDIGSNDDVWIKRTFSNLIATGSTTNLQFIGAQDATYFKISNVFVTLQSLPSVVRSQVPCFKEDTKILCFIDNEEKYIPIQNIRKGILVKTLKNGYVPVKLIGKSKLYNSGNRERIKERLYKCVKDKYPTLFEDLYITGCHSILVETLTQEQKEKTREMLTMLYKTEDLFRLMACLDEKAEPFEEEGLYTIWHLALDNEDYYMNYGIYANGLLVETCSQRYLKELSNMELIE
jgi:hypothetical protein